MPDREKIVKLIEEEINVCESVNQCYRTIDLPALRDILILLKEQEVKTGYWNGSECSNCHAIFVRSVFDKPEYCSHCGAKMEGR